MAKIPDDDRRAAFNALVDRTPTFIDEVWQQMIDEGSEFLPEMLEREWEDFRSVPIDLQEHAFKLLFKASFTLTRVRAWSIVDASAIPNE